MLKRKIEHMLFSNKFYKHLLKPFDKLQYPVEEFETVKRKRAENPVPLNKIPNVSDLMNADWTETLLDMKAIFSMNELSFHRKIWEFNHILYSLKSLGYLKPENTGLAIGAGREQILYYLAHKVKKIVGIDLYEGNYIGGEDEKDIPVNPEKYAPFLYSPEHLEFLRMDALDLKFRDETFDFLFSASSIEHFGDFDNISKSLSEMYRVLKPGGAAILTTEIRLNRLAGDIPNTKLFKMDKLLELFEGAGFEINRENIDLSIEDQFLHNWVKLPQEVYKSPHVILRFFRSIFTSLSMVCMKPGNGVEKGDWIGATEFPLLNYRSDIDVQLDKDKYEKGEYAKIIIRLRNRSNFKWYSGGVSHRIAIGVKLLDKNRKEVNPAFGEVVLPSNVDIDGSLTFESNLKIDGPAGDFNIMFDLKRELITWFNEKGSKPFIKEITIL